MTVLQEIEGLTDRQAAQMAQVRVDWRYALGMSLSDPGFDATILSDFRARLVEAKAADRLLEPILQISRERGWLQAGGKQRTDSTMVLAHLRSLSSLESVGESMRAALNALAEQEPDWLLEQVDPEWFDRYVQRFELQRFPKQESKRRQVREAVGRDVAHLLSLLRTPAAPQGLGDLAEVALLAQIFEQHYQQKQGQVHWRDGPAVSNHERVVSPYDPEARSSRKRETTWLGYKVHLCETCDQEPGVPHLIVQVQTVPATVQDQEVLAQISEQARRLDLAPAEQYVDQGYTSGPHLVEQASKGIQLVGPVPAEGGWQADAQQGYAAHDFVLDWQQRTATCPQGQATRNWSERVDERGERVTFIRFSQTVCRGCPVRTQCTRGTHQGRTLTLNLQQAHEALQARRAEQWTPAFQRRYARRAGIEGTIAQAVQVFGVRQTPYVGTAKTHLHHSAMAAGLNLLRIDAALQALARGTPVRRTRAHSPFARVQVRWNARCA